MDGASLTGMGARTIVGILERAGDALPPRVVAQPNDAPERVRAWAMRRGYHLAGEALAPGFWTYPVLHLRRAPGPDPAYEGLPLELATRWGPLLLRARDDLLRARLEADVTRLERAAPFGRPEVARDLALARAALALWT